LVDHDLDELEEEDEDDRSEFLPAERDGNVYEKATETFLLQVPGSDSPSDYLAHQGRAGLDEILNQFRFDPDERLSAQTAFQNWISAGEA
jgi:hypothetical protein